MMAISIITTAPSQNYSMDGFSQALNTAVQPPSDLRVCYRQLGSYAEEEQTGQNAFMR
jgi:hypothetical protein